MRLRRCIATTGLCWVPVIVCGLSLMYLCAVAQPAVRMVALGAQNNSCGDRCTMRQQFQRSTPLTRFRD